MAVCHTLQPLLIGRDEEKVRVMEEYLKATKLYRNFSDKSEDPVFSEVSYIMCVR